MRDFATRINYKVSVVEIFECSIACKNLHNYGTPFVLYDDPQVMGPQYTCIIRSGRLHLSAF